MEQLQSHICMTDGLLIYGGLSQLIQLYTGAPPPPK